MSRMTLEGQLDLDGSLWERTLDKAGEQAQEFSDHTLEHVKEAMAGAFGIGAIEESIRSTIDFGEKVYDMSRRVGESPKLMQELDFALKMNSSSLEAVIPVMEKFNQSKDKALTTGPEQQKFIDFFKQLGVSVDQLKTMSSGQFVFHMSDFAQGKNPQEFIDAFREIGGRGAGEIIPALKDGLANAAQEAEKFGHILSDESIVFIKSFSDHLKESGGIIKQIGAWFVEMFEKAIRGGELLGGALGTIWEDWMHGKFKGSFDDAKQVMRDMREEMDAEDKRRLDQLKVPNAPPPEDTGKVENERKLAAEARRQEAEYQRVADTQEHILQLQRERMSVDEKRKSLLKELASAQEDLFEAEQMGTTDAQYAKLQEHLEKVKTEIDKLDKTRTRTGQMHVDPLIQAGNFLGETARSIPSIQERMIEAHRENTKAVQGLTQALKQHGAHGGGGILHEGFV